MGFFLLGVFCTLVVCLQIGLFQKNRKCPVEKSATKQSPVVGNEPEKVVAITERQPEVVAAPQADVRHTLTAVIPTTKRKGKGRARAEERRAKRDAAIEAEAWMADHAARVERFARRAEMAVEV